MSASHTSAAKRFGNASRWMGMCPQGVAVGAAALDAWASAHSARPRVLRRQALGKPGTDIGERPVLGLGIATPFVFDGTGLKTAITDHEPVR